VGGRTFESLRIRNYRLFFIGQALSGAGSWMQNVAIGWLTLQLTHSGLLLGLVTAARYLPLLLFGPWGGLIVDRYPLRQLLAVIQVCAATLSALLAVFTWLGAIPVWALFALVLGLGVVDLFDVPARQSIVGALVPPPQLGNAIALNSVMTNTARALGPGFAGLVIASLGIAACFAVNTLSYVAVLISLALMRRGELYPTPRETGTKGQVRAGLEYVCGRPWLRVPLTMVAITGTLTWVYPVTLPLLTSETFHGDASAYGYATSALGIGSIVGGFIAARWPVRSPRGLAGSALLWGLAGLALAVSPNLWSVYAAMVVVGLFAITFNAGAKTVLQTGSAIQMRGRVMALWFIGWQGSTVLGGPLVGAVGTGLGPRWSLVLGGAAACLAGAAYVRRAPAEVPAPDPVPLASAESAAD